MTNGLRNPASALWKKVVSFSPRALRSWDERRRLLRRIRNRTRLVPVEPMSRTYRGALARLLERQQADALGDYLEFGVYDGTSLACMHRVLTEMGLDHVRLFGFEARPLRTYDVRLGCGPSASSAAIRRVKLRGLTKCSANPR